jgi:hypothetical protein
MGASLKKRLFLIAVAFVFLISLTPMAHAAGSVATTAWQSKMTACSAEATGKKGAMGARPL